MLVTIFVLSLLNHITVHRLIGDHGWKVAFFDSVKTEAEFQVLTECLYLSESTKQTTNGI